MNFFAFLRVSASPRDDRLRQETLPHDHEVAAGREPFFFDYHPGMSRVRSLTPTFGVIASTLTDALGGRVRHSGRAAFRRERKLRLGVDIRPFYEPLTGVGWYLHFLLNEIARRDDVELFLFGDARVTDHGPRLHTDLPSGAHYCTFDLRGKPLSPLSRPLTAAAYVAWLEAAGCDLFFGANYFLPRLHAAVARRRVVTVHDLTYRRFPELLQRETLENLERHMSREIAQADAVICVSEATRQDLISFYDIDPARAVTIHSGLETLPASASPGLDLPDRYLLFVSTIEPRKNLGALLDAFEKLKAAGLYPGALVVVGRVGWKSEEVVARMRNSRWRNEIRHLDYLPAGALAHVYAGAEVFVFPSIYEGFGFPLLEAMSHGVPTIAARSSSLPEIGGEASLYFDPRDSGELAAAIHRVLSDKALRRTLIDEGRRRVQHFRWSRTADETMALFRRVAGFGP
jgi:glycosyltransferase involved in cell wall biosynthesis